MPLLHALGHPGFGSLPKLPEVLLDALDCFSVERHEIRAQRFLEAPEVQAWQGKALEFQPSANGGRLAYRCERALGFVDRLVKVLSRLQRTENIHVQQSAFLGWNGVPFRSQLAYVLLHPFHERLKFAIERDALGSKYELVHVGPVARADCEPGIQVVVDKYIVEHCDVGQRLIPFAVLEDSRGWRTRALDYDMRRARRTQAPALDQGERITGGKRSEDVCESRFPAPVSRVHHDHLAEREHAAGVDSFELPDTL
jgi:hypothetical protein